MRLVLAWQKQERRGRRLVSPEERKLKIEQGAAERECFTTPHIRFFLNRDDVVFLQAPSGWYHVFAPTRTGTRDFVGQTLTDAAEQAMKEAI